MPTLADYVERAIREVLSKLDLERRIDDLIDRRIREIGIPHFEYGTLRVDTIGWIRVPFRRRFGSVPAVIALSDYREGKYTKPKYEAPPFPISVPVIEIKVPQIGPVLEGKLTELLGALDKLKEVIPAVKIPEFKIDLPDFSLEPGPEPVIRDYWYIFDEREERCYANRMWVGDKGNIDPANMYPGITEDPPRYCFTYAALEMKGAYDRDHRAWIWATARTSLAKWITQALLLPFRLIERWLIKLGVELAEIFGLTGQSMDALSKNIDRIKDSLKLVGSTFRATDEAFTFQGEEITKALNRGLGKLRASTEKQLKGAADYVQTELGDVFDRSISAMYDIAGLIPGTDTSKVQIRNRSQTGFEFYSPAKGVTMSWLAIGL